MKKKFDIARDKYYIVDEATGRAAFEGEPLYAALSAEFAKTVTENPTLSEQKFLTEAMPKI